MIYLVRVWPNTPLPDEVVERRLNEEPDWIRFDEMTWLVQSNRTAAAFSQRLTSIVGKHGMHLVIEVKRGNAQGQMTKMFWDWINSHA